MNVRHGMYKSPLYRSWRSMVVRCTNPNATSYKYYGAIGVAVCERWKRFQNFYADMGDRPEGSTLDRIDSTKGYEPTNCRWASKKQQARNRRTNNLLVFRGERLTLEEWAERFGIKSNTLWMRLYEQRWDLERALTSPLAVNGGRFS